MLGSFLTFSSFCSVQSLSCVKFFATPWTAAKPGLPVHHQLLEFTRLKPSNHPILCPPLLLLPSIIPSIRVFSNESAPRIRWPKYWSFSFSISPSNEYSGLISFRMDWLDLLAIQGTLKSLLQHNSKACPSLILKFSLQNFFFTYYFIAKCYFFFKQGTLKHLKELYLEIMIQILNKFITIWLLKIWCFS